MDKHTGKPLSGVEHLRQSVEDILTTVPETRVMRREYGSHLYSLVDAPMNSETLVDFYAATAKAIDQWEPRVLLTRVQAEVSQSGEVSLTMEGFYKHNGESIMLEGLDL
jgi:phage baseplate assembly protein W